MRYVVEVEGFWLQALPRLQAPDGLAIGENTMPEREAQLR